jgi:hypothetical protein
MQDAANSIDEDLSGLERAEWKARLIATADANGMSQTLGERHFATFIDQGSTLFVSFETVQGIRALSKTAQPFGFDMVQAQGWSHLCLISDGDTWFRDARIYGFFDQLIDDGFFEDFDRVVFFGTGPCGYAACAYSVAAPGATVVAIQPQATLDPRMTDWDDRITEMRRTSFTDRYGYAPDMLDAAEHAFILYDPAQELDAMHATLFERPNVTRLRMRHMGGALQTRMLEMQILYRTVLMAARGRLSDVTFYRLYRARRDNQTYLRALTDHLDQHDRPYLNALLCRNVNARMNSRRFRRRLLALQKRAEEGEFKMPPNGC